jgi:hypothetical protein
MTEEVRVLTPAEVGKRVKALDATYTNQDEWLTRALASGDPADWAHYLEARREYDRVRLTPYRIAEEGHGRGGI